MLFEIQNLVPEPREILLSSLPLDEKVMYAEYGSRADRRAIEREVSKVIEEIQAIEEGFVLEVFISEYHPHTYQEVYVHYLDWWNKLINKAVKKCPHVRFNSKYFSRQYGIAEHFRLARKE